MPSDWAQIQEWLPTWGSLPERIQEYAKFTGTDPHKVVSLKFRSRLWPGDYDEIFKEVPEFERHGWSLSVLEVQGTEPPIIGVNHETGLEIVCAVFAGLAAVDSCVTIMEKIRNVIKNRPRTHPHSVEDMRIELRRLDPQGNLLEEHIVTIPVRTPIDPNEVASLLSARLSKLDTEPPT